MSGFISLVNEIGTHLKTYRFVYYVYVQWYYGGFSIRITMTDVWIRRCGICDKESIAVIATLKRTTHSYSPSTFPLSPRVWSGFATDEYFHIVHSTKQTRDNEIDRTVPIVSKRFKCTDIL